MSYPVVTLSPIQKVGDIVEILKVIPLDRMPWASLLKIPLIFSNDVVLGQNDAIY